MQSERSDMPRRKRAIAIISIAVAALAIVAVLAVALTRSRTDAASSDQAATSDLPTIKIGADVLEPFFYVGRSGDYVGIDADIAKEACKRADLKPKFVETSWTERGDALVTGTVDCIWSGFAMNEREKGHLWTDSYLDTDIAVLVKNRSTSTSLDDFHGPGGLAVRANSIAGKALTAAGVADVFAAHPEPDDFLIHVCQAIVAPESRGTTLALMDVDTLDKRLQNSTYLTEGIKSNRGVWYSLQVIPQQRDEDGHLKSVLVATRNIMAIKRAEKLSFRDRLTGLRNRNFLESRIDAFMAPGNMPLSLIMADCDRLKQVNDTMGHE